MWLLTPATPDFKYRARPKLALSRAAVTNLNSSGLNGRSHWISENTCKWPAAAAIRVAAFSWHWAEDIVMELWGSLSHSSSGKLDQTVTVKGGRVFWHQQTGKEGILSFVCSGSAWGSGGKEWGRVGWAGWQQLHLSESSALTPLFSTEAGGGVAQGPQMQAGKIICKVWLMLQLPLFSR